MAYVILPDGSGYPIQEGQSPQEAMSAALRQYPEAFGFAPSKPKEDTSGGIAAASAGFKRLKGEGALTLGKMGLMGLPEAEKYYKEQEAAAAQRFTPTQDGWSTSPWLKFRETLGGSLPYMAAPIVAGAAAATLPVSGALSAAALGALGAGAVSTGQFTGSNLARQMDTGKTLEETDLGKAALTAVPQAALDTAAMLLAPGLGKFLGMAGREVTEAGARALANQTLKQIAWDYTKATTMAMTAEGLTEAAQQLLERAQAGLDISDPEARKEYLESLQGGAALAAVLGPFGRAMDRGSIQKQGKILEAKRLGEERAVAEAEQAKLDAAEAERKQQPDYLRALNTQYQTLEQELQALPKVTKPKKIKDATAAQEIAYEDAVQAYQDAQAARKEFFERYKPVKQEYKERFKDIQAMQAEDQKQEALQGGAGPMAQPMLPGFEMGFEQPGAAEQLAAEQENQQYFQQPAEVTPAPATLTPTQQRVELMQQRDTLAKAYTEISGRAMKSAVPEEQRALFNQAVQVKTALAEADAQIKNLGGKLPTLEALQKKEVELTNLAEKAKTAPQKQAVLGKLVEVRQQIATFAAPTVEGQGTLAFKPTAQEIAADKTARAERQKQEALEGGAGPMQQTLIPGLTEPVLPTRKFDVEAEAEPTAFDTQEEARKLSMMADRKEALFKKQEAVVADLDDKASTAPFESYAAVRKAADAERKKADEMRQEVDAMRKQVEDLKAQAAVIPEKTEDLQRASIEKKIAQAQRRFERAQAVGDREMADAEYAKVLKLQEKLAEFPQVNLEQGAAALQAYETALAEKIAAGREQSVEGQRAANVALAKAKADIQALMRSSETAPLVKEARVGKQQDIAQQQRDIAQFEAEGPGAVTPKMPAAKQTEDLRQVLRDIARFEDESPSVFTSAADEARANALLESITQSRNAMKQRVAAANAATRGLRPLNTAVERAAKAAKTAPVEEKAAPTAAPAPAPKTPQTPVEKREEAKQDAVEKQAAAKKSVEEKRAAAKQAQSEKAKPKAEPKAEPKAAPKAAPVQERQRKAAEAKRAADERKAEAQRLVEEKRAQATKVRAEAAAASKAKADAEVATAKKKADEARIARAKKELREKAAADMRARRVAAVEAAAAEDSTNLNPQEIPARFDAGPYGGAVSPAALELRRKSQPQKDETDVALGNNKFVSLAVATQYVQEAIDAGIKPWMFQIHNALDINPGEAVRILKILDASKAQNKAAPKAGLKSEKRAAETKAEEVAKAETETRRLMEEQPDLFSDDKFDSDTDTDNDVALRENNDIYDAFPTNEMSAEAVAAAEDGNLTGVLEALADSPTEFSRTLVKNLRTTLSAIGRRPKLTLVENLTDKGVPVAGLYDPVKNRIYIDNRSMHEETVLHEVVHAVTLGVLRADPKTLTAEQLAARSELEAMYKSIQDDPAFSREYGNKNVEEFVAELMTNSNLRDKLDSVKPGLVQRIYEAIMRFFGMEPKSMSEKAIAATLKIFQPPSPMAKDSVMVPSIMRGVFSGTKAVAAANVDPGAVATVNALVGRAASLGDKITASAMGLRMRTIAADNWAPSEALIKLGVSKGKLSEVQALQMRLLMRVYDDTGRLTQRSLSNGPLKIKRNADGVKAIEGQTDGPSAKKMAQALSGSKLGNAHFVEDLFTSWLAILRAERDGIGYDKLNYGNDKQGNPILNAEKAKAVKALVESDADTKKAFEDARAIYRQYNKDLLQFFVDSGSMTQEKANALTSGDYVPYYRINKGLVQLYVGSSKPITIGSIIDQPQLKELVGGEDKILPVFSGMVQNTSLIVRSAVRNMQMRDVGNMLQDMGLAKIIQGEGPRDVFTARFSSKGEKYYVRLDETAFPPDIPADVVIMGLQGIKTAIPATVKLMGLPANILRKGITRLPTYAYRQLIRDPIHAYMTTGGDFSAVIDTYREFAKSLKGDTPAGLSLKQAGAISSDIYPGSQEEMANALRDVTSGKNGWNINGVLAKLDALGLKADTATRAALYNNFRKKGMSHLEAVLGAAESMNFSRRGTSASLHWLSTMIPFFNSQLQGLDAVYRAAITGDTAFQAKLDARAKLWKRGALMFGMTFAYAALMQDDEAYKTATPLERAQYWFLRIPGVDEPLRIPIPFEPGLMFKVIPEMIFNTAAGDTKARDAMDAFGKMLAMSQPIGLPTGVKPLIELAANYNFYTDAPIISERESGLTTAQQFRNNTTEIAKLLGKTGAISPVSVDHLIRGYTGGLGILLASMANYPLRPFVSPDATDKPARALNEMPVFGSMFQPATGRGVIDAAFKDVEEFRRAAGTYQDLIKAGNRADAAAFADKYAREIALNSTGGSFRQKMGELAALRRQIEMDPRMSSEQKQSQMKQVKDMQVRLAQMIRQMSSEP